jgi:hypothetical protein
MTNSGEGVMEQTKKCSKCETVQPVTNFKKRKSKSGAPAWRGECRDCANAYNATYLREYRKKNKEKIRKYDSNRPQSYFYEAHKRFKENNPDYYTNYMRNRTQADPQFRTERVFSRAMQKSLKGLGSSKNGKKWELCVGYTAQELMSHLESKFTKEMTWDNYGSYWHIDHIIPKSWFKYESVEDEAFKKCWSLDNLQPLRAIENISKGNRYAG